MAFMIPENDRDSRVHARAKERGQKTFTLIEQDRSTQRTIAFWILENVETAPEEKLVDALKQAIAKQWPEPRERRDAVVSNLPTEEDKLKVQTGNTSGPIEDWLSEFDDEQGEVGPREKEFLERRQSKSITRSKASPKASGSGTTST